MDNGKILAEGSPKELILKSIGENVVEARNDPAAISCLRGNPKVLNFEVLGETILISTSEPQQVIGSLLQTCGVTSASVRKATLEDVFLKLTGRMLRE
jgi:lipooligosaccharide transport system ATP-binding protein